MAGAAMLLPTVTLPLCALFSVRQRNRSCACAVWLLSLLLAVVCGFCATIFFFYVSAYNGQDCSKFCSSNAKKSADAIATCKSLCGHIHRGAVPLIIASTLAMVSAIGYCYSGFTLNYVHYHDTGFFVTGYDDQDGDGGQDPRTAAGAAHRDLERQVALN